MRLLLISSSARGHAIADAIKRSPQNPEIISIATTANPGIRELAEEQWIEPNLMNFNQILTIAKRTRPDLAIIGPEDPIAAGLADLLEEKGIPTVAPKKNLARLESSKGFARELLKKHQIDCSPKFRIFSSHPLSLALSPRERGQSHSLPPGGRVRERGYNKEIRRFIEDDLQGHYVIKYDALKGGKGVKVSGEHLQSIKEGVAYALRCIDECGQVVVEEKLVGCEFSLISFVAPRHGSGSSNVIHCPLVQDHKRAYDGDTGSNTGGMGTYSDADHSLPFLTKSDTERAKEIQRLTVEVLAKEFNPHPNPLPSKGEGKYKGILYGGYMATHDGVKLIEFNCRFGDPEALNILPLLQSDFVAICQAITTGELTEGMVRFAKKATVCKYIVPKSYPEAKDEAGSAVILPKPPHLNPLPPGEEASIHSLPLGWSLPAGREGVRGSGSDGTYKIFLGDVLQAPDGMLRLGGSRAIGIVGIGDTIAEAENIAQSICEHVQGPVRFRSDIGTKTLIQQRIDLMTRLRSS